MWPGRGHDEVSDEVCEQGSVAQLARACGC